MKCENNIKKSAKKLNGVKLDILLLLFAKTNLRRFKIDKMSKIV